MTTKEMFLNSPHREAHQKWVESAAADAARDAALVLLMLEQPASPDPSRGWDSHSQLVGARRVLEILFRLHLKDEAAKGLKLPVLKPPQ